MAKDFAAYLRALLAFESGVDPDKWQAYRKDYDTSGAVRYYQLELKPNGHVEPGHVVRDANGDFVEKTMTYKEYFQALGVDGVVDPYLRAGSAETEEAVRTALEVAAYSSINMLGFVGYQIGEAALISAGYYVPIDHVDESGQDTGERQYYYGGADKSDFAGGKKVVRLSLDPNDAEAPYVWATSINEWRGRFVGADIGLVSLETFRHKIAQDHAVRSVMRYNLDAFCKAAVRKGHATDERSALAWALGRSWKNWAYTEGGAQKHADVRVTMSGLLAAAHLVGPLGLVEALASTEPPRSGDETGTHPFLYLLKFAGYITPFDSPYSQVIGGVADFDEVLSAGWVGDLDPDHPTPSVGAETDIVDLKGTGHRTILLHRAANGGKVKVYGFDVATDKIRLNGFSHDIRSLADIPTTRETEDGQPVLFLSVPIVLGPASTTVQNVELVNPRSLPSTVDLAAFVLLSATLELTAWYTKAGDAKTVAFEPESDVIVGPPGVSFAQLRLQQVAEGTRVRYLQSKGGVNTAAILAGVKPGQLSASNFSGFSGSFTEVVVMHALLGKGYVVTWAGQKQLVSGFDPEADWFYPATGGEALSQITLTQSGANVVVSFTDQNNQRYDEYELLQITIERLKEHNFDGFEGTFADIKHA